MNKLILLVANEINLEEERKRRRAAKKQSIYIRKNILCNILFLQILKYKNGALIPII